MQNSKYFLTIDLSKNKQKTRKFKNLRRAVLAFNKNGLLGKNVELFEEIGETKNPLMSFKDAKLIYHNR